MTDYTKKENQYELWLFLSEILPKPSKEVREFHPNYICGGCKVRAGDCECGK